MAALDATSSSYNPVPEDPAPNLYIAHHATSRSTTTTTTTINPTDLLAHAQTAGYDLLTTPITTSHFQSRVLALLQSHVQTLSNHPHSSDLPAPSIPSLTPADTDLTPEPTNTALIALISPWLDLGSPDPLIADISHQVFSLEIAYAAFCGLSNILVPGPSAHADSLQFARVVLDGLGVGPYVELHVLLPMRGGEEVEEDVSAEGTHLGELVRSRFLPPEPADEAEEELDGGSELYGSWETWERIRTMCNYHTRLSIALELPRHLPPIHLQSRWYSEPVRLLIMPRTTFLRNAANHPVLSKPHQIYLSQLLRLRYPPWLLLSNTHPLPLPQTSSPDPTPAESSNTKKTLLQNNPTAHLQYLRHLQHSQPPLPPIERFGRGYQDYMQSPLQPLTDNLESITYEVFEKDPIKYTWYERAIALALVDLQTIKVSDSVAREGVVVKVAVVGAGRGPLVSRVLQASKSTGVKVQVWALEKNPNACVLLQRRNANDPLWAGRVEVVRSDMRSWNGPEQPSPASTADAEKHPLKLDLLVSELLGSFADNELSPECLDGAQHLLHPTHGVSIPQSYTAFITPLASPQLYRELLHERGGSSSGGSSKVGKWEVPYVVLLQQCEYACTRPRQHHANELATADDQPKPQPQEQKQEETEPNVQPTWTFTHPNPHLPQSPNNITNTHNTRTSTHTFPTPHPTTLHGLAGFFEATLYSSPSPSSTANNNNKNNNNVKNNSSQKETTIQISTNPLTQPTMSKDMISWFPIFFPLQEPLKVEGGGQVKVQMWRRTDGRGVWYEWVVESFGVGGGRVGGGERGSSWGGMCLM